jgi:hypothetical protein
MKTRNLLLVVLALVVAGSISVVPAAADDAVVPFHATYATQPTPVGPPANGVLTLAIPGQGRATHLGESTWYTDSRVDTNQVPFVQTGDMEFTAANGDQLFGSYAGVGIPTGATSVRFEGNFTITRGTGRFEDVTGTGTYEGTADGNEGILHFDGELTK